MRKYFFILIFSLISFISFSQTNNLPPSTGNFTIFKNNPVTFTFNFPDGYDIPGSVAGETWDTALPTSQKISVTPSSNVVGQSVTITYSSAQLKSLGSVSKFLFYLVFNSSNPVTKKYILGGQITLSAALGTNNSNSTQITIPDIGDIKINLLGETSLTAIYSQNAIKAKDSANIAKTLAQTAQSAAQTQASISVSAAQSAVNTVKSRNPYGTIANLRAIPDTSFKSYNVIDKGKEGTFIYTPGSSAPDDSSMVIISGSRRYIRVYEHIRPEYFGAIVDDGLDDYIAIQKAFNYATINGLTIVFSMGTYHTTNSIRFKNVGSSNQALFRLFITGAGEGRTQIIGLPGIEGKDLMYYDDGNGVSRLNYITIKDITLVASGAKRCFWASMAINLKIDNVLFFGGEDVCAKIGTYGWNEGYSIYITRCYFNGRTVNGGQNFACLQIHGSRMVVVDQMESDGSRYSIDLSGSDKCKILNSKLEGAKRASIFVDGYGGEHLIKGNTLNPYVGGDKNGNYNGDLFGILLSSGGYNIIEANHLFVPYSDVNAISIYPITSQTGTLQPDPAYTLTGGTSGAIGSINEYSTTDHRVNLATTSGTFITGETLTQSTTGATFILGAGVPNHTYGIGSVSGLNILSNNLIRLNPEYGITSYNIGNIINGNFIEASRWGIYATGYSTVTNNQISVPDHVAVERATFTYMIYGANNIMAGSLVNIQSPILQNDGQVTFPNIPVFADNAAAISGGVGVGGAYKTSTGEFRVRY